MMAVGVARFVAPKLGDGELDFVARRRRFGPIFAVGLALYVGSQVFAGVGS
jgi:hypothetical protein